MNWTAAYFTLCFITAFSGGFCKETKVPEQEHDDYDDFSTPLIVKETFADGAPLISDVTDQNAVTTAPQSVDVVRSLKVETEAVGEAGNKISRQTFTADVGGDGHPQNQKPENIPDKRIETQTIDPISIKLLSGEVDGIMIDDKALPKPISFLNHSQVRVYSVDYHYEKHILLYTALGQIFRDEFVGRLTRKGMPKMIVYAGVEGPVSLAVDWVNDNIYWISDSFETVEMATLDGDNRTLLFDNLGSTVFPNNIVLDPYEGYLFFVSNQSIFRSTLDGQQLKRLQLDDEEDRGVKFLAIDIHNKRLYYTGKLGHIHTGKPYLASADYSGQQGRRHLLANTWNDIFSLSVFRGSLYLAHYRPGQADTVWSVDLTQEPLVPVMRYSAANATAGIWSIRVYHPGVQSRGRHLPHKKEE